MATFGGVWLALMVAFGLLSPLVVMEIRNRRWWLIWFFFGLLGYGLLFALVASDRDDGSVGYALGLAIVAFLVVPAALVFAASFTIKGMRLVRTEEPSRAQLAWDERMKSAAPLDNSEKPNRTESGRRG